MCAIPFGLFAILLGAIPLVIICNLRFYLLSHWVLFAIPFGFHLLSDLVLFAIPFGFYLLSIVSVSLVVADRIFYRVAHTVFDQNSFSRREV